MGGDIVEQRVVSRSGETEHLRSEKGEEQGDATRDAGRPCEPAAYFPCRDFAFPEFREQQAGQQGKGPLDDDEGRRDRAELVVAGQYLEAEFREPHHVAAPREEEGEEAHCQQPPFPAATQNEQAEHGEEHHRGAEVGGAGRTGLVAPVGADGQVGGTGTEIGENFGHRAVRREGLCRRTSHEVRDEQVETLRAAVAPGRGVFEIQPPLCRFAAGIPLGEFRAAPRGVGGVLCGEVERCEVGPYRQYGGQQERPRRLPETRKHPMSVRPDEFVYQQRDDDQQEVVGDLRVVGRYFERSGQRRQRGPEPQVPSAVGVDDGSYQQGDVGHGPHLGDVAGSDDEYRVGRETVGECRNDAYPRVHFPQQRHEPEAEHGREDEHGRFAHRPHGQLRGVADEPCRHLEVNHVGGHTAEGTARPLGVFAVLLYVPFDVGTRSDVLGDVVHVEFLPAELGGEVEHRYQQEYDGGRDVWQPAEGFPFFVHNGLVFSYPAK